MNPWAGSSPFRIHLPTLWLQEEVPRKLRLRGLLPKDTEEVVVDGQGTRILRGARWTSRQLRYAGPRDSSSEMVLTRESAA